jgi:hypothetical protein
VANLPYPLQHLYEGDYRLAAAGHGNGRVAATTKTKEKYRQVWIEYCEPLGVDPTLAPETTPFQTKINTIMCFTGRVKSGWYGHGRQVANGTVTSALTAVGQAFSVDDRGNPLKPHGSQDYHYAVKVMLDGWKKEDLPTMKKLPIEVNIPEYLVERSMEPNSGEGRKAIADLTLIAFYYLLRVGEYTCRTKTQQ